MVKNPPVLARDKDRSLFDRTGPVLVQSLDQEGPLEKEMATHSSILAWEIP